MMSLSSIPKSLLTDRLSTFLLPSGNPHNKTFGNHNHYRSANQYHHHHHHTNHVHNQHDSSSTTTTPSITNSLNSQLLDFPSGLLLRQLNQAKQQQDQEGGNGQLMIEEPMHPNSNSILSFLYSNGDDAFSAPLPSSPLLSPISYMTAHGTASTTDIPINLSPDDDSVQDAFVEGSHLWALLVVGYSIVFTIGVIGNSVLLAALCGSGGRARALPVRNHLMVNLALADLLVTGICVPISACAAASHACW
jgi:hypothetical protein